MRLILVKFSRTPLADPSIRTTLPLRRCTGSGCQLHCGQIAVSTQTCRIDPAGEGLKREGGEKPPRTRRRNGLGGSVLPSRRLQAADSHCRATHDGKAHAELPGAGRPAAITWRCPRVMGMCAAAGRSFSRLLRVCSPCFTATDMRARAGDYGLGTTPRDSE